MRKDIERRSDTKEIVSKKLRVDVEMEKRYIGVTVGLGPVDIEEVAVEVVVVEEIVESHEEEWED